jgi:hypothetical protein
MACLALVSLRFAEPIQVRQSYRKQLLGAERNVGRIGWIVWACLFGFLMFLLAAGLLQDWGILVLAQFGGAAVILIGFSLFIPIGSALVWAHVHTRINYPALLLIWALFCAAIDLGDNHAIRILNSGRKPRLRVDSTAYRNSLHKPQVGAEKDTPFNGEIVPVDIDTDRPVEPTDRADSGDLPLYPIRSSLWPPRVAGYVRRTRRRMCSRRCRTTTRHSRSTHS